MLLLSRYRRRWQQKAAAQAATKQDHDHGISEQRFFAIDVPNSPVTASSQTS
jgi:hypothetical protein